MKSYYNNKRKQLAKLSEEVKRDQRNEDILNNIGLFVGALVQVAVVLAFTVGLGLLVWSLI